MRAARAIGVVLILGACSLWGQAPASPAIPIVSHSDFLRGYFAGYQQGFHLGDLDLQLGHDGDPERYQRQEISVPSDLSDRIAYGTGFRHGFRVAYGDAFEGRSFRAVDALRQIAARLPAPEGSAAVRATDAGLMDGYRGGLTKGLSDGRSGASFVDAHACRGLDAFCAAFAAGFHLGYSDGYFNQRRPAPPAAAIATTASK